jgi:hypothetical protein
MVYLSSYWNVDAFSLAKHVTIVSPRSGALPRGAEGRGRGQDTVVDLEVLLSKW